MNKIVWQEDQSEFNIFKICLFLSFLFISGLFISATSSKQFLAESRAQLKNTDLEFIILDMDLPSKLENANLFEGKKLVEKKLKYLSYVNIF